MKCFPTILTLRGSFAIQRGIEFLDTNPQEKTYGAEGCKLRLTISLYTKLLSILLDKEKLFESQIFESQKLLSFPSKQEGSAGSFEKMCNHMCEGFSKVLIFPKKTTSTGEMVQKWWPYCKYCAPKGYNCYISFSFDFLDYLAQPKITAYIASKTDSNFKNKQFNEYNTWVNEKIIKPINQKILTSKQYSSITMEELILSEISDNLCRSKTGNFMGWPIIINNDNRKERIKDYRGEMISNVIKSYKDNNKIGLYFKVIAKIEKDNEFDCIKGLRIDPLTTANTLKYLLLVRSSQSCKNTFGEISNFNNIIRSGLKTLIYFYEGFVTRNNEKLEFNWLEPQQKLFDGTKYPLYDGGWLNAELVTAGQVAIPDYSLCSSIDVLTALNFISTFLYEDKENIKEIEEIMKILSEGVAHIVGKLDAWVKESDSDICIDGSHWDDRQSSHCEWSDIYSVCKMLEFLLDYCLFNLICPKKNASTHNLSTILSSETFLNSLSWLIDQQHLNGYWPKISEGLLIRAATSPQTEINRIFDSYLYDLGISEINNIDTIKNKLKETDKDKLLSYGNTFQCISVLTKYLLVQSIFEFNLDEMNRSCDA